MVCLIFFSSCFSFSTCRGICSFQRASGGGFHSDLLRCQVGQICMFFYILPTISLLHMLVFLVHMPVHCIISQLKRVVVLETAIQIYATVLHATVCMWICLDGNQGQWHLLISLCMELVYFSSNSSRTLKPSVSYICISTADTGREGKAPAGARARQWFQRGRQAQAPLSSRSRESRSRRCS